MTMSEDYAGDHERDTWRHLDELSTTGYGRNTGVNDADTGVNHATTETEHYITNKEWDEIGFLTVECVCGAAFGPFPDDETAMDQMMDHAYYEGSRDHG